MSLSRVNEVDVRAGAVVVQEAGGADGQAGVNVGKVVGVCPGLVWSVGGLAFENLL